MIQVSELSPNLRQACNCLVIAASVIVCAMLSLSRLPGMELLGIGPQWLLIWVVAWSVKRSPLQGAIAGLALGLIQDGMTAPHPSHAISLTLIGIFTARLQKQRYIQEDFISIAMIVFAMGLIAETIMGLQYGILGIKELGEIWLVNQRFALASAILSSLWAPAVYYPLNLWWKRMAALEQG